MRVMEQRRRKKNMTLNHTRNNRRRRKRVRIRRKGTIKKVKMESVKERRSRRTAMIGKRSQRGKRTGILTGGIRSKKTTTIAEKVSLSRTLRVAMAASTRSPRRSCGRVGARKAKAISHTMSQSNTANAALKPPKKTLGT